LPKRTEGDSGTRQPWGLGLSGKDEMAGRKGFGRGKPYLCWDQWTRKLEGAKVGLRIVESPTNLSYEEKHSLPIKGRRQIGTTKWGGEKTGE